MQTSLYSGTHTALVTPFSSGKICFDSLENLINLQVNEGVNGLVLLGTTGEAPTISDSERTQLIKKTRDLTPSNVPLMVGCTSNDTQTAIRLTQQAEKLGADSIQLAAPYYNKPSQEGLFRHYSAIAETTEKPILLYSHPGRCGVEIGIDTILRLREKYPHISGLKECGGSCDRLSKIINALDPEFSVLSGDDSLALPFISLGAKGIIAVASNLIPNQFASLISQALKGNFASAKKTHYQFFPLFKSLGLETNPTPIKYALYLRKIINSPEPRLPLCPLLKENQDIIKKTLLDLDLLPSQTLTV